eukprot:TRINITY_DN38354_c0_g1_i2.p2 TRINITY_DN38354_c0_g1~~TRINITY_DN38354_c0_g1_i2.p2  ORF type:complete len:136 (-),score=1.68 TRINITY_DN38354_c0_g1_i2:510-917(-)
MGTLMVVTVVSLIARCAQGGIARAETRINLSTQHNAGSPPVQNLETTSITYASGPNSYASSRGSFIHSQPGCVIMADTHTVTLIRQNCAEGVLSNALANVIAQGYIPLSIVTNTVTRTTQCDGSALAQGFAEYSC